MIRTGEFLYICHKRYINCVLLNINTMFKHIILSSNHQGQPHAGFNKTIRFCKKILLPNFTVHNVRSDNSLKSNLHYLYKKNMEHRGSRLNIGGDHSMTIATGACSLNTHPRVKFIWIDAHPDINTYESSITKNVHGMPVAYLTGKMNPSYPLRFSFLKNQLKYKDLLYIGLRSVDPYEEEIIKENNIRVIKSRLCNNYVDEALYQIDQFVGNSGNPLHVSFDVDSLDPAFIPSTGTPVKDGLRKSSAKQILKHLTTKHNVFNMDITELNLTLGTRSQQEISRQNAMDILKTIKVI